MPAIPSRLSIAAALLVSSSTVSAQVAPLILQCKWDDGGAVTYRIATDRTTADAWARWDGDAWAWSNLECRNGIFRESENQKDRGPDGSFVLFDTKCNALADSNKLTWNIAGVHAISSGGTNGYEAHLARSFEIDRIKGSIALLHYMTKEYFDGRKSAPEEIVRSGTCTKTADPSLGRKPAPPPPPTPKF